jgi:acyl-coenzyme A thioesterase PaaI-like protein
VARVTAPVARPEAGWEPVVPFPSPEGTFLHEGDRVRIAYFRKPGEPQLYAKAWFGTKTMGPPGHVHGGAMAAALDEAMGAVCWMNDHKTVAATISVKFLAMLPIESETILEARIERVEGRKIFTSASLTGRTGDTVAEGEGLFIVLKSETLRAMAPTRPLV